MLELLKTLKSRRRAHHHNKQPAGWDLVTLERQSEARIRAALEDDRLAHAGKIARDTAAEIEENYWDFEAAHEKNSRVAHWNGRASAIFELWKVKQDKLHASEDDSRRLVSSIRPIDEMYRSALSEA